MEQPISQGLVENNRATSPQLAAANSQVFTSRVTEFNGSGKETVKEEEPRLWPPQSDIGGCKLQGKQTSLK